MHFIVMNLNWILEIHSQYSENKDNLQNDDNLQNEDNQEVKAT